MNPSVADPLRGKTCQSTPDVGARRLGQDEQYFTVREILSEARHGRPATGGTITRAKQFLPVWVCNIRVNFDRRIVGRFREFWRDRGE